METDAAFVGTNGGVELDTEAAVDLDFAVVIDPRDAEDDLSFGLDDALEDAGFDEVGAGIGDGVEGLKDLGDSLDEFRLVAIALFDVFQYFDEMFVLHKLSNSIPFDIVIGLLDKKKRQNRTVPSPGNCDAFAASQSIIYAKSVNVNFHFEEISLFPFNSLQRL